MSKLFLFGLIFFLFVPTLGRTAPVVVVIGNSQESYFRPRFSSLLKFLGEKISNSSPDTKLLEIDTKDLSLLGRKINQIVDPDDFIKAIVLLAFGNKKLITLTPAEGYRPEELSGILADALADRTISEDFTVYLAAKSVGRPSPDNTNFMERFALSFNGLMGKRSEKLSRLNILGHPGQISRDILKPLNRLQAAIYEYTYSAKLSAVASASAPIFLLLSIVGAGYEFHHLKADPTILDFSLQSFLFSPITFFYLNETYGQVVRQITIGNENGTSVDTYGVCAAILGETLLKKSPSKP